MGRLSRIESIINGSINHYAHTKLMVRGLPTFIDQLLRGSVRFGKRTGNSISVLNPDNTFDFSSPPQIRDREVKLTTVSQWLTLGCLVSLGPYKEFGEVDDITSDSIILTNNINRTFTIDEKCLLYAAPIYIIIDAVKGDTSITIKSKYQIANGDMFAYLLAKELLQSFTEIQIDKVIYLGTTTDTTNNLLYRLELSESISIDIAALTRVYLRAYPAYFSQSISIPNPIFTSEPIGPILLDVMSGNLVETNLFSEIISIRTLNRGGQYIDGDVGSYEIIEKNHLLIERPWSSHYPMFWDLAEGVVKLTSNKSVLTVNADNKFCIGYKCIPNIEVSITKQWKISLKSTEDCTIRFIFNPQLPQEFQLLSGVSKTVTVSLMNTSVVTDIEINILALTPDCEVSMADWTPIGNTVTDIQYTIVVHAIGQSTYQSTGLIIKPYFLGSELLKSNYDVDMGYDSGKVYF